MSRKLKIALLEREHQTILVACGRSDVTAIAIKNITVNMAAKLRLSPVKRSFYARNLEKEPDVVFHHISTVRSYHS
jgi:hypothetical protein